MKGDTRDKKNKPLKATLGHQSLPVALSPGSSVNVKLVKAGYITQEFSYTVPASAATVTKTMIAEKADFKFTATSIVTGGTIHPGDIIELSITIKNEGNKADTGKIIMGWDSYIIHAQFFGVSSVAPGASKTFPSVAFEVPTDASVGAHQIFMGVQPTGEPAGTDTRTVPLTVTALMGTLSVTTSPTAATVKVGAETKTSPCNFTLAPGTHTVTVSKPGYDTITDTAVAITAGETTTKSYTLVLSKVTITFDTKKEDGSTLTGVEVWIGGVKKGTT